MNRLHLEVSCRSCCCLCFATKMNLVVCKDWCRWRVHCKSLTDISDTWRWWWEEETTDEVPSESFSSHHRSITIVLHLILSFSFNSSRRKRSGFFLLSAIFLCCSYCCRSVVDFVYLSPVVSLLVGNKEYSSMPPRLSLHSIILTLSLSFSLPSITSGLLVLFSLVFIVASFDSFLFIIEVSSFLVFSCSKCEKEVVQ